MSEAKDGIKHGQAERAETFANHFGMKVVDISGGGVVDAQVKETKPEYIQRMAEEIVLSVKQGVQSKVASVNIGTQDEAIREKAMELMSDEESALAHFSFFDIPIPIGVQQAD